MGDVKIPNWLKGLPLAPEFHPTHTEFSDPIAYISKIEKEASEFGICKIIPPLSKPPKKYVFSNLNKSLAKRPELGCDVNSGNDDGPAKMGLRDGGNDGEVRAVFTTRQQELGQTVKRAKGAAAVQNPSSGVDKQVWQSGEVYTLEQFESKARAFSKNILGTIRDVSPLVTEAMFWKAASEKPIYVEYANDVPGSAFEEPEGQLFYSHRQRRKRNCYQRTGGSSDSKKSEMNNSYDRNSQNDKVKDAFPRKGSNIDAEVSKSFASPGTVSTDETPQSANKKNQSSSCDTEGTAGWKLSNSPWNLQVIARSPGSLTRFMPDDIPGVTSPMVYIGMLFSWFAWHIEDHELHSMNYLHNGSSKTWYSVPGADVFAFEELIRTEAYGGTADHLAALSLLGNKTTLMSPEVLITSGIPCCRLVQNPGEFVVTFPRAYHVGFSHGFNCGEAANFGTPQWLKVAKEAAVRRAAMNYYPMLSHQQLLYLSTMSFISRVPRALLPGVRSSRIRDRQREDRELSVKKAFIEDILNENDVLSALLGKDSSYRAVLWNPDLLPFACKESPIPTANPPVDASLKENVMGTQHGNSTNAQNLLVDEMSLYMENLDDLYLGSDDLSSDFQVDSGTLACVACGILGFPFMSVVQPSEKASMELNPESFSAVKSAGVSGLKNSHLSPEHHKSVEGCATDDLLPISNVFPPVKDPLKPCTSKFNEHWNTVDKFLRPRSFCLEHAVETLELLQCKGGANMLVICHSDYQKIKAPAAAIAEEIDCRFNYKEVPLDSASMEDLNLIDLAVDDGRDECGEDWTSKLGINLRYCVKVRKSSSSKRVQHALALGGIFSKQSPNSEFPTVKWKARRSRSKKVYLDPPYKQCDRMQKKKEEATEGSSADVTPFKSERKVIQYSRRNKQKSSTPTEHPHPATSKKLDKHNRRALGGGIYNNEKPPSVCARLDSVASKSMSEGHSVAPMIEATRMDSTLSQVADTVALTVGSADVQIQNHSPEERNISSGSCSLEAKESFMHDEIKQEDDIKISKGRNEEPRSSHTEQINRPYPVSTDVSSVVPGEISAAADVQPGPISHSEEVQAADRSSEGGYISSSVIPMEETHPSVSLKGTPDVRTGSSLEESMSNGVTSAGVVKQHAPTMEALTHNIVESGENQPIPLLVEVEVSRETCATNATLDDKEQVTKSYRNKELDTSPDTSKCEASHVRIKTYFRVKKRNHAAWDGSEVCISKCDKELERINANILDPRSSPDIRSKRKKGLEQKMDENFNFNGFIRGPCEGLRPRAVKDATIGGTDILDQIEEEPVARKVKRPSNVYVTPKDKKKEQAMKSHICNLGSCRMSFHTLEELRVHKHNRCPHEGCGKKFSCHKYAMVHTRVHESNRPFKCPWPGCSMSFKWVWAQTEHIRVHTGEKPYKCKVEGCGLSFRYVSDFSRHRRKTGHYVS